MNLSRIFTSCVCVFALIQAIVFANIAEQMAKIPLYEKIASVQGKDVFFWEIKERLDVELNRLGSEMEQLSDTTVNLLFRNLLQEKVMDCFLLIGAEKENLSVDRARIDSLFEKFKNKFETRERLAQYLELRQLTEADIREKIESRLKLADFQKALLANIDVSGEEVEEYIREHPDVMDLNEKWNVSQIFKYAKSLSEKEEALKSLKTFRDMIVSGEKTFKQVALESSDGATASKGGYLGWISSGKPIDPVIKNEIQKLSAGEISQPFETEEGVHMIHLTHVLPEMTREELQRFVKENIKEEKRTVVLKEFFNRMKEEVSIQYFQPTA